MGTKRCAKSIEAEKLYKSGKKPYEIAEELGVPAGTVRRWKSTQDWDGVKKKQGRRSDSKVEQHTSSDANAQRDTEHREKQPKGGPAGNKKAQKHGAYSKIYWDWMDDEERELLKDLPTDEEAMLVDEIMHLTVRERRIEQAIKQYSDAPGGIYLERQTKTEVRRSFKDEDEREEYEERIREKVENGDRLPGDPYNLQTETEAAINLITRLEKELTTVQKQKNSAIATLANLRLEKAKLENESVGNAAVDDWISSMMGGMK